MIISYLVCLFPNITVEKHHAQPTFSNALFIRANSFKEAGGGGLRSIFPLLIFLLKENVIYQELFSEKYCS